MKQKPSSVRIALLLSLMLFVGLIYYSSQGHRHTQNDHFAAVAFGVDLDLKWVATADQSDFQVVQDTLNHYAGVLGQYSGAISSRFQLDHLGDAAQFQGSSNLDFYKAQMALDFETPETGPNLIAALMKHGFVDASKGYLAHGFSNGELTLNLPIPGSNSAILHVEDANFQLRLVPRMLDMTAGPEA